nr:reverse transcriptase domain-containing protein [Tanacetum cinerariifolium]
MSAIANTTLIVTTVTKTATKEKTPNGAETASRINILDFCEEHYEDILPVIDKIRRDKRRETLSARYRNPSERPQIRDRSRNNYGNVFGHLGHQRESAFKRLRDTYSPNTTKSGPDREYSRDDSHSKGHLHKRNSSPSRDRPQSRGHSHDIKESYGNTYSYRTGDKHRYHSHGTRRSSSMKRRNNSESSLSRVSKSGTSKRGHWKSKSKRRKPTDEEDLAVPWSCEEVECWAMPTWCHMFNSTLIGTARVWFDELPPESINGYMDLKAAFLAYFMQQKKYVKDPVEIYNIKQKDGETIEEFMERFKIETGCMKKVQTTTAHGNPLEKRSSNKFCEFHNDKGHITDECVQLRKQIKELITFPPLAAHKGTGGPLAIEAEINGHAVHRIYVDGGSSMELLYEHCFNRLMLEIKSLMFPATTSLTDFSGKTIWPLGQLRLLVTIGDAEHYTRAWMNFMIVRIVTLFQKSIERSNPFAATALSVSWTPTKAIIKYRWPNKMRKRRLSTLVTRRSKQPFILEESPVDTMADQRTMAELLRAPTEGYAEAIVVPRFLLSNSSSKLRDNIQGYVLAAVVNYNQGNSAYRPPGSGSLPSNTVANPKGDLKASPLEVLHTNTTLADALILMPKYQKMLKAFLSNKEKLQELANTPLNENCSAVILKKLPEKLRDLGNFSFRVVSKLGLSKLISTRMNLELANRAICTPARIARDVFVQVGKFTFLDDFVIVDYESDPRVPLILGRPFLRTAHALIGVHGEEMILRDGNVLPEKLLDLDSTKDLHPLLHVNPLSGSTTYSSSPNQLLEEFADELSLITFPPEYDDDLQFDIDNLADLNDNLFDSMPKMFTDEHALDYSSPLIFDEYDDDLFEVESNTENVYNDPFYSKGEKIKESKLLIDELDLPCDFLPSSEYDSFPSEDFYRVDALPSTNNEDKVVNPGILIQENLFEIITHVIQDKKLAISHASLMLEDFDPPLYELPFFKEVPRSNVLLPFSSENEEKVFKPGIRTSEKLAISHASLMLEDFDPPLYELPFFKEVPRSNVPRWDYDPGKLLSCSGFTNLEIYVDDLVIKSHTETELLWDIEETFRTLRRINIKLNPKKSKRLRKYFQAHPIVVIIDQPIKQVMSRPDVAGRLQKWSIMLGAHNITYRPRTFVKGQILADFLVEKPNDAPPKASMIETPQEPWTMFIDGSSCVDGSGARLILTSAEETEFTYALSVDYKLVANQVLGTYVAKEENMAKYREKAKSLISGFANFSISQVLRSKNKKADALRKIASTSFVHLSKHVLVEVLKEKSIQEEEVATIVEEEGPTWLTPIMEYLKDGTLPGDKKEASKLRIKARQYELWEGVLYRRSFLKPWLRNPQQPLTPITAPWPFYKWGIDIAGLFPKGPRKVKFLIVAMDYFINWIEAKAVATITGEKANWSLDEGIKAHLVQGNKNWIEELPHVLWAYRAMIKSSHGDTLFSLTYGTKAVIPAEIRMPTYHTAVVDAIHNNQEIQLNLDLLEERRECATIREAKEKLKMTKYYNTRVRGVTFRLGDFVYRSNEAIHAMDGGKLGPKWEGPYEVTEALGDRAYRLRSMDGDVLPRTWNVTNLKKYYL